jgi:hypothetical protein
MLGSRIGVLGQLSYTKTLLEIFPQPELENNHLGIDADRYNFRAADAYKYRALNIAPDYSPQQWAFVPDAVQSGDLMGLLGWEKTPFVLREIYKDERACEFLFLGPAILQHRKFPYIWENDG